jgi:hypothetical protein
MALLRGIVTQILTNSPSLQGNTGIIFLSQLVNTATLSPDDDVPHYVIPPKLRLTNDSIFNKLPVFLRQWEKEKAVLYPVEVPPP